MRVKKLLWSHVVERWSSIDVPGVSVVTFNRETHDPNSPWLEISIGEQPECYNPQIDTARAILVGKSEAERERLIAMKLQAYCRDAGGESSSILDRTIRSFDFTADGCWNHRATHTLPYTDHLKDGLPYDPSPKSWEDVVDAAGRIWSVIANKYSIVRIPILMDFNSNEYKEWNNYVDGMTKERELAQYERLKQKYDSTE